MAVIVREALVQEVDDVALLMVEAYREYSHTLTSDNWAIMRTNLSNVAAIAQPGRIFANEITTCTFVFQPEPNPPPCLRVYCYSQRSLVASRPLSMKANRAR
jgi:hypothetical protein